MTKIKKNSGTEMDSKKDSSKKDSIDLKQENRIKELEKKHNSEIKLKDEQISKLEKDLDSLKDLSQRRQADFENYKKRTIKLQEDLKKMAIKDFALEIIMINDDLLRAIDSAEENTNEDSYNSFVEGISMISKRIETTLENFSILEIEALGEEFNPNFHEAIEIEESEEIESEMVTKVHQKGFKIDDLAIRSSKVKVTKPKAKQNLEENKDQKKEGKK